MNVLVTGHNGFIGRAVTRELVNRGHWVRLFSGDVRDRDNVHKQVHHYDVVIHLAAKTPGWAQPITGDELAFYVDHNLSGAITVAAACEEAGKSMLFAATRLTEGAYGRSKQMAEKVVTEEYGALAIRVSMAYGPGQRPPAPYGDGPRRLVPTFVCNALTGKQLTITGDARAVPDLVYIDDVAEAYADWVNVVRYPGNLEAARSVWPDGVDISGPGHANLVDIADTVQREVHRQTGRVAPIVFEEGSDASPPPGVVGRPGGTPLDVGIRKTVTYYRSLLDL